MDTPNWIGTLCVWREPPTNLTEAFPCRENEDYLGEGNDWGPVQQDIWCSHLCGKDCLGVRKDRTTSL